MGMVHVALVFVLLSLLACGQGVDTQTGSGGPATAQRQPEIYTVNYPLTWAAQQLLGEEAEVRFPAPADVDPASWQPDRDSVAAYQQADLILLNGANYARWLSRASLPDNRLLDTSRAFADQLIALDSGPVHSHGPQGDHSHGEVAFTLWLDLGLYVQQVQAIARAIVDKFPQLAVDVAAREKDLVEQLTTMDGELEKLGRDFNGAPVLYSHPVYQYFERRYAFNGRALHWEPNQFPTQQDWSELRATLKEHPAAVILWEEEPLPKTRARLKDFGVESVVFSPMGNRPVKGDFLSGMSANIERLKEYRDQINGN